MLAAGTFKENINSPRRELLLNAKKKATTKVMIQKALIELKTEKGVSLYAIKKYMENNYNFDTKKKNFLIKNTIKAGVKQGSIIQITGIGASGSFKLGIVKQKREKIRNSKKYRTKNEKNNDAVVKSVEQEKNTKEISNKTADKEIESKKKNNKIDQKMQKSTKSKITADEKRQDKTKEKNHDAVEKTTKMEKNTKGKSNKTLDKKMENAKNNKIYQKMPKSKTKTEEKREVKTKENIDDAVEKPAEEEKNTEENNYMTQDKDNEKGNRKKIYQKVQKPTKATTKAEEKREVKIKMEKSRIETEMAKGVVASKCEITSTKTLKYTTPKKKAKCTITCIGSSIKKPKMKPKKV